jgi:hypothetical protein
MKKMPNMHGNHEATCLCCIHFDTGYDGGYSDVTPGVGWYSKCLQGHFYTTQYTEGNEMHELYTQGRTCVDFEGK